MKRIHVHRDRPAGTGRPWVAGLMILAAASLAAALPARASDLDIFLVKCGGCHKSDGQAAPVNPADKAGLVWKKYFKRNRHPIDLSDRISGEEQARILSFLEHHAADSDHPVAAIIPK